MLWFVLFISELAILFFLSQQLTKKLANMLIKITKSQKTTISVMAMFFFPGVFIHEFSHLLMANALFVRTGEIEFFPQIEGDRVKLGSVAVSKSDPLRRFFIGIAPIIGGISIMFGLSYYFSRFFPGFNWQSALLIYSFFEIGNTMFSSKKDMEGAIALFSGVFAIVLAFYLIGLRVQVNYIFFINSPLIQSFLLNANDLLFIPIIVNVSIIGVISYALKK